LSKGELLSAKLLTAILIEKNSCSFYRYAWIDKTDAKFGDAQPLEQLSKKNVNFFKQNSENTVNVITGFIGSTTNNDATTLGRNGSNYTASLIANYLNADELQNYTCRRNLYCQSRFSYRC
jgi:aspartokinase/homoserine dehydrogenase 1